MKRTLIACAVALQFAALPTVAQAQWIGISESPTALDCDIALPVATPVNLEVIANMPGGVTIAEFRITTLPPTILSMGFTPAAGGLAIGDPFADPTGVVVAYPGCNADAGGIVHLGTIQVLNFGTPSDFQLTVVPTSLGGLTLVDCVPNPPVTASGGYAILDPALASCGFVPVELMSLSVE